jgi:hypothetical protein
MAINEETLAKLDLVDKLNRLPDTTLLTTELAAAFLSSSVTSLERMRVKGSGPAYSQGGAHGARGTNQKCLYKKADLLAWHDANKVTSSMAAAIRKGQT